jgi:hypothetical protein
MRTWIALGLLALFVRPVLAQFGGCPNDKATGVHSSSVAGGHSTTCQFGIVLFGVPIGIDTVDCPSQIYDYPPHKECLGEASPGHYCGAGPMAAVSLRRCSCAEFGGSALSISLPLCLCRRVGNGGVIPTGQTFDCIDD